MGHPASRTTCTESAVAKAAWKRDGFPFGGAMSLSGFASKYAEIAAALTRKPNGRVWPGVADPRKDFTAATADNTPPTGLTVGEAYDWLVAHGKA